MKVKQKFITGKYDKQSGQWNSLDINTFLICRLVYFIRFWNVSDIVFMTFFVPFCLFLFRKWYIFCFDYKIHLSYTIFSFYQFFLNVVLRMYDFYCFLLFFPFFSFLQHSCNKHFSVCVWIISGTVSTVCFFSFWQHFLALFCLVLLLISYVKTINNFTDSCPMTIF
jgi:hypothetical protein